MGWLSAMVSSGNGAVVAAISAASSVVLAGVTARLSFLANRNLEQKKAEAAQALEERKVALVTELERAKAGLQISLESSKAKLADELAEKNARRGYEYDAQKRLYTEVEPLLFSLFEAAEGAFHAVASLARTQRNNKLPEFLSKEEYYLRSITHRLLLPMVLLRLLQRRTTLVDLGMDASIRLRYRLLKECYLTFSDDFGLAGLIPIIAYEPNVPEWREARKKAPARHWKQGLVIGHLDRVIDGLIVQTGDSSRPMNFGEMETALRTVKPFREAFAVVADLLNCFDFHSRPVFGRMLMTYAGLLHILMSAYEIKDIERFAREVPELINKIEEDDKLWLNPSGPAPLSELRPYIEKRVTQAVTLGSYVQF